jgi:glycosyltransferase involved in cell wall biosynthesis
MNILIVDFEFPEPDRSSGGHRLYHIVKILREAGHELAFLSIDHWQLWNRQEEKYDKILNEMGVRTHRCGWSLDQKGGQLIEEFVPDVAILSKHYMAHRLSPYLRRTMPMCRQILDTVDVHFVRERRQGIPSWPETRDMELAACQAVDRVWAITPRDQAQILRENIFPLDFRIVPNIHNVKGEGFSFEERMNTVFVGNMVHDPNRDAVLYMQDDIIPRMRILGWREDFFAVGPYEYLLSQQVQLDPEVNLTGYVENLDELLQRAKVGIAPLRYGAGMKGKIGSYMENGLPVVTTTVGAEGMGLTDGVDARIDDNPAHLARIAYELTEDKEQWETLRRNALAKVAEWSSESLKEVVLNAVQFH